MLNDATRGLIIAFVQSIFPFLNLAGIITFTSDEISAIMLMIGNGLTLLFFVLNKGQGTGPHVEDFVVKKET